MGQVRLLLLITLLYLSEIETKRRFNLEFYNYTCLKVTQRVKVFECQFEKLTNNHYVFNERLMLFTNLDNKFQVQISVFVKPRNSKKGLRFIDLKLNVCDILANKLQNPLLKVLLNELRRSSNIPFACPFKGNFMYKMSNYSFTEAFLPTYTPNLNFTFNLGFYEGNTLFAITNIMGAAESIS